MRDVLLSNFFSYNNFCFIFVTFNRESVHHKVFRPLLRYLNHSSGRSAQSWITAYRKCVQTLTCKYMCKDTHLLIHSHTHTCTRTHPYTTHMSKYTVFFGFESNFCYTMNASIVEQGTRQTGEVIRHHKHPTIIYYYYLNLVYLAVLFFCYLSKYLWSIAFEFVIIVHSWSLCFCKKF